MSKLRYRELKSYVQATAELWFELKHLCVREHMLCVCKLCICTCVVHFGVNVDVKVYVGPEHDIRSAALKFLPYTFEMGSLTGPGAKLVGKFRSLWLYLGFRHTHTWLCTWVLSFKLRPSSLNGSLTCKALCLRPPALLWLLVFVFSSFLTQSQSVTPG